MKILEIFREFLEGWKRFFKEFFRYFRDTLSKFTKPTGLEDPSAQNLQKMTMHDQ